MIYKFADKYKEKNTQEKEGKKDGELAVARTEQSITEYYTGVSYLALSYNHVVFSFAYPSNPSLGTYYVTLQIVGA